MKKITIAAALIAVAVCSAALYAMEPEKCTLCRSYWDAQACGSYNNEAHVDGEGWLRFKVLIPHGGVCESCSTSHPTPGDECIEALAKMEKATVEKVSVPSLGSSSPELVAYIPGRDYAELFCKGEVVAVIPIDEVTAAESLRLAEARRTASGGIAAAP